MTAFILYPLLTSALYYLLARAEITRGIWRRYPRRVDRFMACAACTGFWYGLLVAATLGRHLGLPFAELEAMSPYTPVVVALCSIIWTPVVAWLHLSALERLFVPEELVGNTTHTEDENANQT